MLRFEVGPDDIGSSRFAVSPLTELGQLLRTLYRSSTDSPLMRRHHRGFARVADDPGVQAVAYLQGPSLGASFAAPPPSGLSQTLQDDLAEMVATDPVTVAAEIAEVRAHRRPATAVAAVLDDPHVLERLADAMRSAWQAVLAAEWPRVQAVLHRDVRFRAERLATEGWAAAVGGVHERIRWLGDAIGIAGSPDDVEVLGGRGLLLIPSVFSAYGIAIYREAPWQPTIVYPSRGAGLLFAEAEAAPDPLAPLLGRTRAGLLLALSTPSSTTQLAALTGASIGATGDHLRVLLDAGLVTRERMARSVVYRRTPLGDALATAS